MPKTKEDGWFLLGILNAPVADFVFKHTSKPKEGGFYEANKQFIAPLPIPDATPEQKKQVAELAEKLQAIHSDYRDSLQKFENWLNHNQILADSDKQKPNWIWPDLPDAVQLKNSPEALATGLKGAALTAWTKQAAQAALDGKLQKLTLRLSPSAKLSVDNNDGEVMLRVDGITVFSIFANESEARWIAAQWRQALRKNRITPSVTANDVLKWLLNLKRTDTSGLRERILELDKKLEQRQNDIAELEKSINVLIYALYGLSADEIKRIELG